MGVDLNQKIPPQRPCTLDAIYNDVLTTAEESLQGKQSIPRSNVARELSHDLYAQQAVKSIQRA